MMSKRELTENKKSIFQILLDFSPLIGALFGLLAGSLYTSLWGLGPISFFKELFTGAFGTTISLGNTLNRATPLLLIGTGTAIAFRAGANNIGQEGQLFVGGLSTAVVALLLPSLPGFVGIPAILLLSALFGMVYAGIAVTFRLLKGVNELLITLLLNYIATLFISAMITGPFAASKTVSYPMTDAFNSQFLLARWPSLGYLHAGIFIALGVVLIAGYFMWRTPAGLRLRMVGLSPMAARTAGSNPTKVFIAAMLLSGALCGMAGAVEVLGTADCLRQGFGTALGFDGLAVALIGGTNPLGVLPAGLFFGALRTGMQAMQRSTGIPSSILDLIKGCIMVFIMLGTALKGFVKTPAALPKKKVDPEKLPGGES